MLEEIENFREGMNVAAGDSVHWTAEKLENIANELEQEMIDETMDNQLTDVGYVQLQNLVSGRVIYRSPEITQRQIKFQEIPRQYQGYWPFEIQVSQKVSFNGIGYMGIRINKHYFVGVVAQEVNPHLDPARSRQLKNLAHEIVQSISRKADVLYLRNQRQLQANLTRSCAWAYVGICEDDTLIWLSKPIKKSDIYMPELLNNKEYYETITDNQNQKFRQYTLIYDEYPDYLYQFDLAIPTQSVQQSLTLLAFFLFFGATLLVGIIWGGGHLLTRRTLQPVDDIIQSVNDITTKNLEKRLPVPKLANEIVRLVHTFNQLLDRLATSFNMQKAFIADASHELRTPLGILMSDIETALKELKANSPARKSLANAVVEIDHMARIVDDLHWLARSDAGQVPVNIDNIRLDEVLMATLSRCQVLARQQHIKLLIENMDIIEFKGDEELLIRALSNLVNNAIKYSHPGGTVRLTLVKNSTTTYFVVQDDGIGIPPQSIPKIFDRFYRVDDSRARATGGSGLGLAIAKWICEVHGGTIKVTSKENSGSTFTIELPI